MRRGLAALGLAAIAATAGCGEDAPPPRPAERPAEQARPAPRPDVPPARPTGSARPRGFDPGRVFAQEGPGVVTITSVFPARNAGPLGGRGGGAGQGSGFVISQDGEVATNAHVVTDGEDGALKRAKEVYVTFEDGNEVPARIVGEDPNSDVALLKIDPKGLRLRSLPLGRDAELAVGEPVVAIGSPYGEAQSVSVGIVSGLDRTIDSLTNFQIPGAVQTDAAINKGNSGGPLVDGRGRVIGINSQIRSTGGGGEGVGFAVPVDTVRRSLGQLRESGRVSYAFLGITSGPVFPQLAERFGLGVDHGAWVQTITPGGPAAKAGLRAGRGRERFHAQEYATGGDVVARVEDTEIEEQSDLSRALTRYSPGDRVRLEIYRDGRKKSVEVTLAERPRDAKRPPGDRPSPSP